MFGFKNTTKSFSASQNLDSIASSKKYFEDDSSELMSQSSSEDERTVNYESDIEEGKIGFDLDEQLNKYDVSAGSKIQVDQVSGSGYRKPLEKPQCKTQQYFRHHVRQAKKDNEDSENILWYAGLMHEVYTSKYVFDPKEFTKNSFVKTLGESRKRKRKNKVS